MQNDIVKQPKAPEPVVQASPSTDGIAVNPAPATPINTTENSANATEPAGSSEQKTDSNSKVVDSPANSKDNPIKNNSTGVLPVVIAAVIICLILVGLAVYSQL